MDAANHFDTRELVGVRASLTPQLERRVNCDLALGRSRTMFGVLQQPVEIGSLQVERKACDLKLPNMGNRVPLG